MENLTDKQKEHFEKNKMFDLAEFNVMEYIEFLLKENKNRIFTHGDQCKKSEPLIFYPIQDYNPNIYLSFEIKLLPPEYQTDAKNFQTYKNIKEGIDFLVKSVYEVFFTIMTIGITDEFKDEVANTLSLHLEFDEETFSFVPIYLNPNKRKILMCQNILQQFQKLEEEKDKAGNLVWDKLPITEKNKFISQVNETIKIYESIEFDEEKIKEDELTNNAKFRSMNKLFIIVKELEYQELPDNFKQMIDEKQNS